MRFALITDVHFGPPAYFAGKLRKLSHQAGALTRAFVSDCNERDRPDLVVNLGDVIEDSNRDHDLAQYGEFVRILGDLDAPLVHVAGNHDTIYLSEQDLRGLWQHSEPLFYTRRVAGIDFVVLHTLETKDVAVRLPPEQLTWLEQVLERVSWPCIVLMHHPASELVLTGNRWFENAPHICRVAERRRLREILKASGKVVAVFNGHVHWNHFDVIDGIPYMTLQSLTENLDDDAPGRPARATALCDLNEHRLVIEVRGEEPARYQLELRRP